MKNISDLLIGKPLANEQTSSEKYNIPFGLAIMASDAISSVAYAAEEILNVLIIVAGLAAYGLLAGISLSIIALLAIVTLSYMQVIKAYPQGGGAYLVAKENIKTRAGLVAGAGLIASYILTVAVSASAGASALISAFPGLLEYKVPFVVILIIILTILNLRGIGESSKIFAIPTYIFIFSMVFMILYGMIKFLINPASIQPATVAAYNIKQTGDITLFLILRAFSQGCSALTGVEAVSNSVPNFKEPCQKNANIVMILLSVTILVIFGGSAIMAGACRAVPNPETTVIAQIAISVFGKSFMFYVIQFATAVILLMACNTAFTGFPMLMYVIAKDGFAPRQFTLRGKRLSFSIGIIVLSAIAGLLVIIFKADVHSLIPLYSVGVFLSFTLAQLGMVLHWRKVRDKGWILRASINGFGAFVTLLTTLIIAVGKFTEGAWIVVILLPIIVVGMEAIKRHYTTVANALKMTAEDYELTEIGRKFTHIVVVPLVTLNRASVSALQYAHSISDNVIALNVSSDKAMIDKLSAQWNEKYPDKLLVSKYSPYRQIVNPIIQNIKVIANAAGKDEKITVILPEFVTHKWWGKLLHNHTGLILREGLLSSGNIVVSTVPYHIADDK